MAYTREETENVEVDYPVQQLWEGIPKAIEKLEWTIEQSIPEKYCIIVKTEGAFLSYPTNIKIALVSINDKTTRMLIAGETPVTTVTSVLEFRRTRERIERFIVILAQHMEKNKKQP
ncbi:MAG: hypothetical protein FWC14_08325 [Candidatus Bathyarchaeota archaeon]|uniref:hypothetical protein n=1 Tax=Candidatus Bathycorpusculum sp. TaxID=2994959 RepID=UPI00283A4DF4|nr:hypothetical protein [Candidatus Termiticorpusculum sp.]MCL2291517.1 hypothetical protein [Candidatus Termiticorpusculum sp.]